MDKLNFRKQEVSYMYGWSDNDTFGFDFGDGEFTDSEGMDYFIRLEYHVTDNEWIVEIWWEDDNISIDELDKIDADDYITVQEIEDVKEFAKQFIESGFGKKEIMKNQLSVEMYIEAFKNKYNYDAIDELDFESESFVDKINESIMDYEDDDENPDKDTLAEIVYDILYSKQYGDTSDENDLEEIRKDIESRFPEG